ncbi:MAG: hypothetical protein RLZZ436_1666 [Planctomycetota bacterium]|jgi:hypothetical protein
MQRPESWRVLARVPLLLVLCTTAGCLNPQFTRLPTWQVWSQSAENQAYEQHYPFSDPDVGPATDANPRGYDRPRTATRRAAEQRVFQGIPAGPESKPQSNSPRRGNRWRSSL